MDPDVTMRDLVEISQRIRQNQARDEDAEDLAVAFQAMDVWIRSGGFLPKRWERKEK